MHRFKVSGGSFAAVGSWWCHNTFMEKLIGICSWNFLRTFIRTLHALLLKTTSICCDPPTWAWNAAHTLCTKSSLILAHSSSTVNLELSQIGTELFQPSSQRCPRSQNRAGCSRGRMEATSWRARSRPGFPPNHCCGALAAWPGAPSCCHTLFPAG